MRRGKIKDNTRDHGDGFYTCAEKQGAAVWRYAMHLESPGGFVTKVGRYKKFSYHRDAMAQIAAWRAEDAAEGACEPTGC